MPSLPAEFEEKEYEFPLYYELVTGPGRLWTPGQVLEGRLGFDCAVEAAETYWTTTRRPRAPGTSWRSVLEWSLRRNGDLRPNNAPMGFGGNVFLQAKRPCWYHGDAPPRGCAPDDEGRDWYTIKLDATQQGILEELDEELNGNGEIVADVTYAAPVFRERRALWGHSREQEIVGNSTFPLARDLNGHSRWAYVEPGAVGQGLSEPEKKSSKDFAHRVAAIHKRLTAPNDSKVREQIRQLHKVIMKATNSKRGKLKLSNVDSESARCVAESLIALLRHRIVWLVLG